MRIENETRGRVTNTSPRLRRPRPIRSSSRRLIPWTAALALVGLACSPFSAPNPSSAQRETSATTETPPGNATASGYEVDIDPADFDERIDNPYFPLEPGTVFRLRGETEDGLEREKITVTARTKEILGVTTTVVEDVIRVHGELAEFTYDWYAQDRDGNVWYFGEDTTEYEDGKVVTREGSWESGVDGAAPGIIMSADPEVTDSYRMEYYEDHAEDMYWVVATGGSKRVPFGGFDDVVRTLEWSPLEPRIVVEKFYAPGIGLLAERALSGPKEAVELLDVIEP